MNNDSRLIFEAYKNKSVNENMPYPEFAKLSKHAASKLPEDKPKERLKYDYEWVTAFLPRDIDISNRAGEDKVLDLAFQETLKRLVPNRKNPRLAARNMFGDEDFPQEIISQYAWYQEHGFPNATEDGWYDVQDTEKNAENDFREQMPDSNEEYSAHDYAKELEAKGEQEERRLDPKCWSGYHKAGTKMKGGTRVNNCVKNQEENQKVDNIDAYQTKEVEQEEGALPSLYQFHKMLQRHDWSYDYSDDSSVWRKGQQQEKAIMDAIKRGGQPYRDFYDKYVDQEKSGEKIQVPQKDRAELDQDRDALHSMKSSIEEVRDKMYNDIDANSISHPQQLWDLYYPAINILKVMKNVATEKGYKTLLKSLDAYNI
jgi:hypothetical protein